MRISLVSSGESSSAVLADRPAHLGYTDVREREREPHSGLHADAHVLEVLAEERLVHAPWVARVLLPLRKRRPRNHFQVGLGFRGLRYPFPLLERYRDVGADSRHAALIRDRCGYPADAILDRVGNPVAAPGDVGLLGEGKVLVVARVVFADERPISQPRRRIAKTPEHSVDLLPSVSERDLGIAQSLGGGGKLSREKAGAEGVLRPDRDRGHQP